MLFRCYSKLLILFVLIPTVLCDSSKVHSKVLELNDKFLEVKDEGFWFVEFYAPWCGHCKKLHPIWEQVAYALVDKGVHVARLDCTRFTSVAGELGINGFPTIKFFREGEVYTYDGDRERDALVSYAIRASGPIVGTITSESQFNAKFQHYKNVAGMLVFVKQSISTVTESDDDDLFVEFVASASKLFTKASFFELTVHQLPKNVTVSSPPAVIAIKDNKVLQYDKKSNLTEWLAVNRWPSYVEISYGNLHDIGNCCNRLLAIVVSDIVERSNPDSNVTLFEDTIRDTIDRYGSDLLDTFQFGWLDGPDIANSITLGGQSPPSIFVLNMSSYQFYLMDDSPVHSTAASIKSFLINIKDGEIKAFGGRGVVQRFKRAGYDLYITFYSMFANQPLLSVCLFGLPLGIMSVICYTLCTSDISEDPEDYFEDSDENIEEHEKRD